MMTKDQVRKVAPMLVLCAVLGVGVDFAFNGVFVGFLFNQPFTEKLCFFYVPLFLACAMTVGSWLTSSPRWHGHTFHGVAVFLAGVVFGHLGFVGHHGVRVYTMDVDTGYGSILLRSSEWPQILFITSDNVKRELASKFVNREVPVTVDVVSDYGCDRAAVISTVAGVDVRHDDAATWTWQVDHLSGGAPDSGPGMEDKHFFWCRRPPPIRQLETNPGLRPWEQHARPGGSAQS